MQGRTPIRLFCQIVATIALAEAAVMWVLPELASGMPPWLSAAIDAVLLSVLSGPVVLLLVRRSLRETRGLDPELARRSSSRRKFTLTGMVLLAGLGVTMAAMLGANREVAHEARARFERMSERLCEEIVNRANHVTFALRGAPGVYGPERPAPRPLFEEYVSTLDLDNRFPGVAGIGFIERLPRSEVDAYVAKQRAEGAEGYKAWSMAPAGSAIAETPDAWMIKYAFPAGRNHRAWGLDIGSEPTRRDAAERAARSGEPTISARLELQQEPAGCQGLICYMPVYRPGAPVGTPEQREAALAGLVYAPIVLEGSLAGIPGAADGMLDFEVIDEAAKEDEALLFDLDHHVQLKSGRLLTSAFLGRRFEAASRVEIGGRLWTITTSTRPGFEKAIDHSTPAVIGLSGTVLSVLSAVMCLSLLSSRERAVNLARGMTSEAATAKAGLEVALREVSAFRATLDQHSIISVTDRQGRIIDANPQFCRISGYSREELIGQTHAILNSGHHPHSFWAEVWRTICSGQSWRGEVCNKAKDGTLYWVDSIIAPFTNPSGQIERFVTIRNDITRRKQAEEAVARTVARLKSIIVGADLLAWEFCVEEDRFIFLSFDEGRLGYPREQWLAPGFWNSKLHPEDREKTAKECLDHIRAGRSHRLHYRMITAEGKVVYISDYISKPERIDGKTVVRGVAIDVTDRVDAERRVAESESTFRTLADSSPIFVWMSDQWGLRTYFNRTWLDFRGRTQEEEVGTGWRQGVHPDDLARIDATLEEAAQGNTSFEFEYRLRRADGVYRTLLARGAPRRDASGSFAGFVGACMDMTEFREAQRSAEAANRAKSEFLANMSHEIRTPLTSILGFADILREENTVVLSAQQRGQLLDTIRNAGQHLLTIINDILDISKIEAEKMTVERVETPLVELIGDVASICRPRAEGKGLRLEVNFATPLPTQIIGDPTRLRQILMNLVGNAVKFTELGSITIEASVQRPYGLNILRLDIIDTGEGMNQEQAARLFQSFAQADTSVTRKYGGTGLGLIICRRLAVLMGGSVRIARTEPGKGSTFRVELPLEAVAGAPMADEPGAVRASHPHTEERNLERLQGRILLAEDGTDNQRLISFHLRKAGAAVEVAENGKVALDMIEKAKLEGQPFDLLLSDMQMPEMDGYTLARTLRARGSELPIIALTAHAMAEDRRRCMKAGCNDYATKPIDKPTLIATCAIWLTGRATAGAA